MSIEYSMSTMFTMPTMSTMFTMSTISLAEIGGALMPDHSPHASLKHQVSEVRHMVNQHCCRTRW